MNGNKDIFCDPWLKKSDNTKSLPGDALFVCAYDLNIGMEIIEEAAFFRRTETTDELWIVDGFILSTIKRILKGTASLEDLGTADIMGMGCALAVPKGTEQLSSCLDLLDHLFRARVGFDWPQGFLAAGIINKSAFNGLVKQIENELKTNAAKTKETETEIIKVARELGLYPRPTGKGPNSWQASCPETNHPLYINSAENAFGCGWCGRKGSVQELRAFVEERKKRRNR